MASGVRLNLNKLPIYKGVLCVEAPSANGARWWYAGGGLHYSPVLVDELSQLKMGRVQAIRQNRVIARFPGHDVWFAVNLARSDVAALQARSIWSPQYPLPPFDAIEYSDWPQHTRNQRAHASCAHLR